MGLLDGIFDGFSGPGFVARPLRPNLRRAQKLESRGTPATARIVGIRIRRQTDASPDHLEWALELTHPATGAALRVGCRQRLGHARLERIRLGDEVRVHVDEDANTLIDEDDGSAELSHKVLKHPPSDGIEDENVDLADERRKSLPAQVVVRAATPTTVLGMATMNLDLDVDVTPEGGPPYRTRMKRELVPFYALHLVAEGTVLPGTARPGRPEKVRVDWPAAAMAHPGNGLAPARPRPVEAAGPPVSTATPQDWTAAGLNDDGDLGRRGGISFDQWVAVSAGLVRDRVRRAGADAYAVGHGVPAGTWSDAEAAWTAAMMTDLRIGARYGSAFEQARKRR